ncbi:MAG TPA: histidine--tRNA ligase [Verrucomicrobiae bacterium]|nr:histidine--tRNA ligase [Verrucomicrobiae bacterium]
MQALTGFRDFFPEACARRNRVFQSWRRTASRHGFVEYDGPPLESLELFTRKSGPEIVKQLYNFVDKGEREVAFRAEMTPTFARMVGARHRDFRKPIKWFAIPQLMRYERPQKGRLREHFQFNADLVGFGTPAEDAEMIALLVDALRDLGLGAGDFRVRLSSRAVWHAALEAIGVPVGAHGGVFDVVDKLERVEAAQSDAKLGALGLGAGEIAKVRAVCGAADLGAAAAAVGGLGEAGEWLQEVVRSLQGLGAGDCVAVDLGIVRGLAYYTGVVFEAFALGADRKYDGRAVAGGGRYDDLLKNLAGVALPAVGFGMGDVVLGQLLEEKGLAGAGGASGRVFVAWPGEGFREAALGIVRRLREAGFCTEYPLRSQGLGKQLEAAENAGAGCVVIVGDDLASGMVDVKWMADRRQERVAVDRLEDTLAQLNPAN